MGTASNQDNQDGALEITVSGEKYRCLRFAKAKKWSWHNDMIVKKKEKKKKR